MRPTDRPGGADLLAGAALPRQPLPSRLTVWLCRLTGQHEPMRSCGPDGLYLTCLTCGWRSPGWPLPPRRDTPPPIVTHRPLPPP